MRRIEISEEVQQQIVSSYRAGTPVARIASGHGYGQNLITRVVREAGALGIRDHDPRCKFTPTQEEEMVTLYRDGASLGDVARRFGSQHETVWRILKRRGLTLRAPGGKFRQFTDDQVAEVVKSWEGGETQASIAARLGISQPHVSRLLRIRGKARDERRAAGPRHGHWKGGRIEVEGYVHVRIDPTDPMHVMANSAGYVPEHRLVMARHLGRPLLPTETVHHIKSSERANNRIENLQLRQGKHGKGAAFRCLDCGSSNVEAVPLS